jgi:hypothetical protein
VNSKEGSQISWSAEDRSLSQDSSLYKNTYVNLNSTKSAMQKGKQAARSGVECLSTHTLIFKKGYSMEEAKAYIDGYKKASGTETEQLLRKAKRAGYQAALLGFTCPSYHQLRRKNYTNEQIEKYHQSYRKVAGNDELQMKRRVRLSGYQAAKYGCKRPSENKLRGKGYSDEQIQIYYAAFDKAAGLENEQLERKVKRDAYQMARMAVVRPNENYLLKRGLDKDLIKLFYSIFDKTTMLMYQK